MGSCGLQISLRMASKFYTRMYTHIHAWVEERLRPLPGPSWGDLLTSCSDILACGSDCSTRGDLVNAGLFQKMITSEANKSLNPNRLNPNRTTADRNHQKFIRNPLEIQASSQLVDLQVLLT